MPMGRNQEREKDDNTRETKYSFELGLLEYVQV